MTDDQRPSEGESQDEEAPDLPPPSTFAGKKRAEGGEGPETPSAESELPSAGSDSDAAETDASASPAAGSDSDTVEASEPATDKVPDSTAAAEKAPEPAKPAVSQPTVEADTLSLADIEAQREAAHAGLAARAKKSSFSHEVTTGSHKVQPPKAPEPAATSASTPPAAPPSSASGVGEPPKRRIGWRFTAAAFVIVSSMAAATAVSFLLFLNDIAQGLNDSELSAARQQLEQVEGGSPQTILILGSDKRSSTKGDPGRSDTAILVRVDPEKEFLSLLSMPRDLEVPIPGHGTDKLNAAYSYGEQADPSGGGETLAIQTIKEYLGIPINHVVNVDFGGFYEAVNAIDCVYIDVDRHYFNPTGGEYAEIDVQAGYQKLCGYKALQYVRYRHNDNDLVRGARQQDFIREARQRIPPAELLPVFGRGDELIDIFTKNTSSDIDDPATIVSMLKSFAAVRSAPVRQVSLGRLAEDGGVEANSGDIKSAVNQFLGNDLDAVDDGPAEQPPSAKKKKKSKEKKPKPEAPAVPSLIDLTGPAQTKATEFAQFMRKRKADLPIFFPTRLVQSSVTAISEESRSAVLVGSSQKDLYYMYKFVVPFQEGFGLSYYGLSGTNWDDPPILKNPSTTRTIDGRDYLLFYEQDRLRLVGWQTSKGSYWVINTLTHALTEDQMLGIASSARELGS